MSKSTDIRIATISCRFEPVKYRTPLKFGGRVVDTAQLVNVDIEVETRSGHLAAGRGSMPLGNVWAWPSAKLPPEKTEQAMKAFAETVVELADRCPEYGHPVDLCYHLWAEYDHLAKTLAGRLGLGEPIPELAQLVAASPLDAAIHDAYGRVHDANSYDLLSEEFMAFDLSEYLDDSFADEYLDQYTLRRPKDRLPLYHLVGALDPLTADDVEKPIRDGLPEHLAAWIAADGLTHLKIKLAGDDLEWDVNRVLAVERTAADAQQKRGCTAWVYSLDFNEKCPNEAYVVDFLNRIRKTAPAAFERIQYVEQPLPRDLAAHPDQTVHKAAKLKPVVVDESLVDFDSLLLARDRGYTGVALKACKGQTESLLLAAAAQKFGMFLCVQDLTCPGFSFLHSASLAARIPGVAAIEGNARQFCPAANKKWVKPFPSLFEIKDGTVGTGVLDGLGLGF